MQRQVARLDLLQPLTTDMALDTVGHLIVGKDTYLTVQRHQIGRLGRRRDVCAHDQSIPTGTNRPVLVQAVPGPR
jgi:hypothetical protein